MQHVAEYGAAYGLREAGPIFVLAFRGCRDGMGISATDQGEHVLKLASIMNSSPFHHDHNLRNIVLRTNKPGVHCPVKACGVGVCAVRHHCEVVCPD